MASDSPTKHNKPITPLMKGPLETNAKMTISVMEKELAVSIGSALQPQGLARAPNMLTMNLRQQTNAQQHQ